MEKYKIELEKIEHSIEKLIDELGIKFDTKRLLSFATLSSQDYNLQYPSYKLMASEIYINMHEPEIKKESALGIVKKKNKKATKHQIFLLGNRKLQKMTREEAIKLLSKAIELVSLYDMHKAKMTNLQAEFELKFSKYIACSHLSLLTMRNDNIKNANDSEYLNILNSYSDYEEYNKWNDYINELDMEEQFLRAEISEELTSKLILKSN